MSMSAGMAAYKLSFELSPIIFTNGIADKIPGGMLPIIAITEALNFTVGLLSGGDNINLDNFFANFRPLPGGTLVDNQIGMYPFANQEVAANAIISQPLAISMLMLCPVRQRLGYASKLASMMALQKALDSHNSSGGTYTIATPSYFYTNCVMTGMRDITNGESAQAQSAWQLDFAQPLLTLEQATQAENSLISKITKGTPFNEAPAWSGLSPTVGLPPTLAAPSIIPAASGAAGAGAAGT
jgi:hypothetical protein